MSTFDDRGSTRVDRREFLGLLAGGAATIGLPSLSRRNGGQAPRYRAIAFDAFAIFDPRPVAMRCEERFPGHGAALVATWRTRQFEYTWLRSSSHQYVDFERVTADALAFAARSVGVSLSPADQSYLMEPFTALQAFPDVLAALRTLHEAGVRLAFLSNATPTMLLGGIKASKLDGLFEYVLSTDAVRDYKPSAAAYQLGVDRFGLSRDQILFVPFAGWDAAGAKWFGYPTFWVNRQQQPAEELGVAVDGSGSDMAQLTRFVLG
jgi:2-haloacid dehalogenase